MVGARDAVQRGIKVPFDIASLLSPDNQDEKAAFVDNARNIVEGAQ